MKKLQNKPLEEKMEGYAKLFDEISLLISLNRKLYKKIELEKLLFNRDDFCNIGSFLIQKKDINSFWDEQKQIFDYEIFKEKVLDIYNEETFLIFKDNFEKGKYDIVEILESEEDFKEKVKERLKKIYGEITEEKLSLIYSELKKATKDSMKLETPSKICSLLKDEGKDIAHKALVELCQIRSDLNINKNTFTLESIKKEMEK
ncbi:hypothetical protein [Fusobacterium mortiferum]|jgi:hypothetical protein|uniref:hypothetical protein n=1 Tax=Fusobacterium mortiferum TaxID=850 RepID=UPI000E480F1F|nr:hypothetical protein [Fusobacterium mortiferum]RHF68973.1 hypothetical protein DW670_00120 [Fusobacterium mortiferum]